jgi:hypothetical protein
MKEIVECRYIGEKHGVQNERTSGDKNQPLLHSGDVMPTKDAELSAKESKLTSGRWLGYIAVSHTPPQK